MFLRLCNEILSDLESELLNIREDENDIIRRSELSVAECQRSIERLRSEIISHRFISKEDEITFFKVRKPQLVSLLIYHLNIYNIELNKPTGSIQYLEQYYETELKKIHIHYNNNQEFYRYYRSGSTFLDEFYFIRGKLNPSLHADSFVYDADPSFCTSHDFKVSNLLANERLQDYLEKELNKLAQTTNESVGGKANKNTLKWTGSKVALTELLYALFAAGVFDNGRADIKTIATHLEQCFDIELGKFYRMYSEIKSRNEPTKFLDDITNALLNKMEEDDRF